MTTVIHVAGIRKAYGAQVAVDDVSFEVVSGEIFGLIGPNGAGKTTTMECVEGLRAPDRGTISVLSLDPFKDSYRLQDRIGVQLQEAQLQKRVKVWEAVHLWAALYPRPIDGGRLLDQLGLSGKRNAWFMTLSGGQKQRLFVALALINDPEVVFLDELTTGLDPQARRAIWDLVRDIRERGKTVFLTTHLMEGLCCNFRAATSGWTTFGKHRTGSPIMPSDNPFKWRQFEPALILQCVRWYLRYALSYRDLEDMMRERGLCVDHTTIYRWVQRYAPEIDKRCRPFLRRTNDSYRIDETYVRVAGAWTYLYRGVDSNGDTLDFLLRATRDRKAAIAFFRKTLGAAHTTPPRVVTVDKNPAYPVAFEAVRHEGLVRPRSNLRQCKYLNNIIEQDHRFIKRRTRPMLGFKRFTTAWRTLRGIEIMHALRKGQARWMAKGDVVGQTQLIHKVFGLAA